MLANCSLNLLEQTWIKIWSFLSKKIDLKISSPKWQPFCIGLTVLKPCFLFSDVLCTSNITTEQTTVNDTVTMPTVTDATGLPEASSQGSSAPSVATVTDQTSPSDVTGVDTSSSGNVTDVTAASTTKDPTCYTPVLGGTVNVGVCHFPFMYNMQSYSECITLDRGVGPWCSTTEDVDVDDRWGLCQGNCTNMTESRIT